MKNGSWGHSAASLARGALLVAGGLLAASGPASAALTSVSGPLSVGPASAGGTAAMIIPAPANILNTNVVNTGMQGFDEAQGVTTSAAYFVDGGGVIAAGTVVDSHMIFLNSEGDGRLAHLNTVWQFDGVILGVMSDSNGFLEASSSLELGAPGTNYAIGPGAAPFRFRGLETFNPNGGGDTYTILAGGTSLAVNMLVSAPGDWIRVITAPTVVPLPAAAWLFASALGALGIFARRRKLTA